MGCCILSASIPSHAGVMQLGGLWHAALCGTPCPIILQLCLHACLRPGMHIFVGSLTAGQLHTVTCEP
jgi:hypothetical protein